MSQLLPYEQLIAAKLEQLPPLPGLADEIWLRIETDLDADPISGDEGDDPGPGSGPAGAAGAGSSWIGWSLLIFLGTAAIVLFQQSARFKGQPVPVSNAGSNYRILPATPVKEDAVTRQPVTAPALEPSNPQPSNPQPSNTQAPAIQPSNIQPSITQQPSDPQVTLPQSTSNIPDSNTNTRFAPIVVPGNKPSPDSTAGRRKPTGIKINQDDYKVVPQKDTGKGE